MQRWYFPTLLAKKTFIASHAIPAKSILIQQKYNYELVKCNRTRLALRRAQKNCTCKWPPYQNSHVYLLKTTMPTNISQLTFFFQQNEVGEISARAVNLSIRARGVTFRVRKQPFSIILMKEQFSSMRAYYLARNGDARIRILGNGDRMDGRTSDILHFMSPTYHLSFHLHVLHCKFLDY